MGTTKKNSKATPKKVTSAEDILKSLLDHASKSGIALKKSTANNAGVYPIVQKDNGTSAVTRLALYVAAERKIVASPAEKVKATDLINIIKSPEFVPVTSLVDGMTKSEKPYKNFTTLKSRLTKEVSEGRINSFQANFDPKEDMKAILPEIQKLLK